MTLKKIPDSYVQPNRAWPASERYDLLVGNPAAQETQVYGTRKIKGAFPAHNHGENGGELLDETLLSEVLGPQTWDPGNTRTIGIPLCRQSNAAFLFVTYPKGLYRSPLFLPGGVSALKVKLGVYWQTNNETIRLRVWLGTPLRTNYKLRPSQGAHPNPATVAVSIATTATPSYAILVASFTAELLAPLGDPRLDRLVELIVWQEYDPSVAARHRLVSVSATRTATVGGRNASPKDRSIAQVTTGDILAGQALSTDVVGRLRTQTNGLAHATLGKPPGLREDLVTPDRRRSFVDVITRPHQHQGSLVPDAFGAYFSDGVVPKGFLFHKSFPIDLGDNSSQQAGDNDSQSFPTGARIHPSGVLNATWLDLKFRCPLPAGLLSFYVQFAVYLTFGDRLMKTRLHIGALPLLTSTQAVVAVQSGGRAGGPAYKATSVDADGLLICEVDPVEIPGFLPGRKTRRADLSPWSGLARLRELDLPPDVGDKTRHQVSEPVRVELTHPAVRASGAARSTEDYMIRCRLEVELDVAGTYDSAAAVNWICGVVGES
jgi:hypothetical protein